MNKCICILFPILFFFVATTNLVHGKKHIYLFPGQGSDHRIFTKLDIDTSEYEIFCVEYGTPTKDESLKEFALRLSKKIDTTQQFVLMGVSLGGMICVEIAHHLNPEKTIIISSAKTQSELPKKYTIQERLSFYHWIPPNWYKSGALFFQPIVEPDRKKEKSTFVSMLKRKTPLYFKRSVGLIVNWNRTECFENIIHIHGSNDHTIPMKNTHPQYVIKGGSHMMTLTDADKINPILSEILCFR